jgi:hypothetical protein
MRQLSGDIASFFALKFIHTYPFDISIYLPKPDSFIPRKIYPKRNILDKL